MIKTISNFLYNENIQHLDVENITKIIYDYVKIDLTKDDYYADQFINEKNNEIYKIKNGWFIDDYYSTKQSNCCTITTKELKLKQITSHKYKVDMNYWKEDICFGFESTLLNSNGKIVEFHIENINNIQIGNSSSNGILSFLSKKDNFICIKAKEKQSESYNFIHHASHLTYDTFYFVFNEPIVLDSGKIIYYGDTINIPDTLRCKMTNKIILEDETYNIQALEIINKEKTTCFLY